MHLMNQQSCLFLYRLFTYLERIPLRNLWCRKDRQERPQRMSCVGKPHQTFPNQFFHQIIDIDSSRAQKRKWEKKKKKFWRQQHPVFPGGHPSKYWLGSMLLNFSDRTRTGVFNMIWPLARKEENFNILFQQHTCIHIQDISILCPNWLNMPISEEKKNMTWVNLGFKPNLTFFFKPNLT